MNVGDMLLLSLKFNSEYDRILEQNFSHNLLWKRKISGIIKFLKKQSNELKFNKVESNLKINVISIIISGVVGNRYF